jgi:hypothetical protein
MSATRPKVNKLKFNCSSDRSTKPPARAPAGLRPVAETQNQGALHRVYRDLMSAMGHKRPCRLRPSYVRLAPIAVICLPRRTSAMCQLRTFSVGPHSGNPALRSPCRRWSRMPLSTWTSLCETELHDALGMTALVPPAQSSVSVAVQGQDGGGLMPEGSFVVVSPHARSI